MIHRLTYTSLLLATVASATALADEPARADTTTLAAVQVVANRPPPMWAFTRGDQKIVVFGTHYPLLKGTRFNQSMVEAQASQADAFVGAPGLVVDDSVSMWKGLSLWRTFVKAKRNPDGKTLKDVLPADTYARWSAVKRRYMGNDRGVEKLRPMYAAYEIYQSATQDVGIVNETFVVPLVERLAEAKGQTVADARIHVPMVAEKATANAFDVALKDDVACLEETLDTIDALVEYAPAAADAWASGDLNRYRLIVANYPPPSFCWGRLTNRAFANMAGMPEAFDQVTTTWLQGVYAQLGEHDHVFTYMSARSVIEGSGAAAALIADGWQLTDLVEPAAAAAAGPAGAVPATP